MAQVFVGSTSVDDEAPYYLNWELSKWGKLEHREPNIIQTAGGVFAIAPLSTAIKERRGSLCIYAQATDVLDKHRLESDMRALLYGSRVIHRGSRHLNVTFLGGDDPNDDTPKAPRLAGVTAEFVATDPYWYLNQPLTGLGTPVNIGDEWSLYDDGGIPAIIPDFVFSTNSFTLNNWGNAPTFAAGTVTNGPTGPCTIYLNGAGGSNNRLAIAIDASENGTFVATSEFLLSVGSNAIRVEDAAGALQTVGGSFSIDFGNTYMRFH